MKRLNGLFVALALLILAGFALGRSAPTAEANGGGCPFHAQETHAVSTDDAGATKDDDHDHGHGEDVLHESMEGMEGLFREVRRGARGGPSPEEVADKLAQLSVLVLAAKDHAPHMIEEAPEGQRAELMQTYRLTMIELAQAFLSAEAAMLEGRTDDAWEHLLVANEIKGRGHELFLPEDEDH